MSLSACAGAIQKAFEYFAGRAALGFIIPEWLPTPDNQQYSEAVRQLDSVVYSIIDSRRAQLAASSSQVSQQVGGVSCISLAKREFKRPHIAVYVFYWGGSVLQDANALGFTESPLQM